MVLPSVLFSLFQSSYPLFRPKFTWVYYMQYSVVIAIMLCPVLLLLHNLNKYRIIKSDNRLSKPHNKHNQELKQQRTILKEMLEDMLQDCKMESNLSTILYLYGFYRKFLLALFLNPAIPGLLQIVLILCLNILQAYFLMYMVSNKLYTSKVKMTTRSITIVCIIVIETIILAYNINYLSMEMMILLGVTCTYLTIIATIGGIVEMVFKIFDTICQKV